MKSRTNYMTSGLGVTVWLATFVTLTGPGAAGCGGVIDPGEETAVWTASASATSNETLDWSYFSRQGANQCWSIEDDFGNCAGAYWMRYLSSGTNEGQMLDLKAQRFTIGEGFEYDAAHNNVRWPYFRDYVNNIVRTADARYVNLYGFYCDEWCSNCQEWHDVAGKPLYALWDVWPGQEYCVWNEGVLTASDANVHYQWKGHFKRTTCDNPNFNLPNEPKDCLVLNELWWDDSHCSFRLKTMRTVEFAYGFGALYNVWTYVDHRMNAPCKKIEFNPPWHAKQKTNLDGWQLECSASTLECLPSSN